MLSIYILVGAPIVIILFWAGVVTLLSYVSGWVSLAKHYATYETIPADAKHWKSAVIGLVSYNGILTVAHDEKRLYLRAFAMYSFSHKALSIPWADVTVTEKKTMWQTFYVLQISKTNSRIWLAKQSYWDLIKLWDSK